MEVRWITAFVDRDPDGFDTSTEFWRTISGSTLSPWRGDDAEFATFVPADGTDAHLRVQRTRSGKSGSHIDLHVADVRSGAEECVGLGAATVADRGSYAVLASPGGMVFCIVPHHGEHRRQHPVARGAGGPKTLVDQIAIDCDPDPFDDEVHFWASVTGWAPLAARAPEFVPLDRPSDMPLRIMLQRRSRASGVTSCHFDLACEDVPATVEAHEALGGSRVSASTFWTVMADPSGTHYCLTQRQPATGVLPP